VDGRDKPGHDDAGDIRLCLSAIVTGSSARSSRNSLGEARVGADRLFDLALCLISVDPVNLLQAVTHRLLQIVPGLTEGGVAAGEEVLLLALQNAHIARVTGFTDRPGIRPLHFAIEVGKLGIGADRLFNPAPGGRRRN
jgi:hypothetical protein